MIAAADQRRAGAGAQHPAGRVGLGDEQHCTHEQEHYAKRGHFRSSRLMIRRNAG